MVHNVLLLLLPGVRNDEGTVRFGLSLVSRVRDIPMWVYWRDLHPIRGDRISKAIITDGHRMRSRLQVLVWAECLTSQLQK